MAKKNVAQQPANETSSPAATIRSAKGRISEASRVEPPRCSPGEHPASVAARVAGLARREIASIPVPMTLGQACSLIGYNVRPDDFVATAFDAIAQDVDTLSNLAERVSGESGYEGWVMFQHLATRARFAGEVASLLAEKEEGAE